MVILGRTSLISSLEALIIHCYVFLGSIRASCSHSEERGCDWDV